MFFALVANMFQGKKAKEGRSAGFVLVGNLYGSDADAQSVVIENRVRVFFRETSCQVSLATWAFSGGSEDSSGGRGRARGSCTRNCFLP